jgi:hypothetical protein
VLERPREERSTASASWVHAEMDALVKATGAGAGAPVLWRGARLLKPESEDGWLGRA